MTSFYRYVGTVSGLMLAMSRYDRAREVGYDEAEARMLAMLNVRLIMQPVASVLANLNL